MAGKECFEKARIELDLFLQMPRRCQELVFKRIFGITKNSFHTMYGIGSFVFDEKIKSPIEKIFQFAFDMVLYDLENEESCYSIYLEPQAKIKCSDKTYYADFLVYNVLNDTDLKIVVECDGHEFHERTKEQVKKGNERDFDLKREGYDVIHFSGSQIYEKPYLCARQVYDFAVDKIEKAEGE